MRRHPWRLCLFTLVFASGPMMTGCSGSGDELPREPVSGVVSIDGEPLANGTIQFAADGGGAVAGGG